MARSPVTTTAGDAGGATVTITVQGGAQAKRMLAQWKDPELSIRAQRATMQGAEVLRRPLKAEARKVSERMGGPKGVSIVAAKVNRPAAVVSFTPFFSHWVIGGTRTHGPKRKQAVRFRGLFGWVTVRRVRGVRPNPIIERVAKQYQRRVFDAMIRSLTRQAAGARR